MSMDVRLGNWEQKITTLIQFLCVLNFSWVGLWKVLLKPRFFLCPSEDMNRIDVVVQIAIRGHAYYWWLILFEAIFGQQKWTQKEGKETPLYGPISPGTVT